MTVWFVSRHPGALEWMRCSGHGFDRHVAHLTPEWIAPGDQVFGSLPINLAAEVCARGARYWHLSLRLGPLDRGRELSADELEESQASLAPYFVSIER